MKEQPRKKQMFMKMTNITFSKPLIEILGHKIQELSQRKEERKQKQKLEKKEIKDTSRKINIKCLSIIFKTHTIKYSSEK